VTFLDRLAGVEFVHRGELSESTLPVVVPAKPKPACKLRVISWNLAHRVGAGASHEADLIRSLHPDLALLQEANAGSIETLAEMAGFDWVRWTKLDGKPARAGSGYLAAVAGQGAEPEWLSPSLDVPFPDRVTAARIRVGRTLVVAAAYHAPPGVSWGLEKAQQAVAFAHWLTELPDLVVLGADANTPMVDHPDFRRTLTHWQTGVARLKGAPGDDLLWGHTKVHGLDDALRVALANSPTRMQAIRDARPDGPLEVSFRTLRRNGRPSTPWRFDSIWISKGIRVVSVDYFYDRALAAGSDHALVLSELLVPQVDSPSEMGGRPASWQPAIRNALVQSGVGSNLPPANSVPAVHEQLTAAGARGRREIVYTRRRNPEGDWILIKNPKVYSSVANWATTEIFGTEQQAREWANKQGMTVSERERWLNSQ
jgi:hypothetical protein